MDCGSAAGPTPRQSRWSPHWPVLKRSARHRLGWFVLPPWSRWSPRWPVLPAMHGPIRPEDARRSQLLSSNRWRFPGEPLTSSGCAAATIPVVPARGFAVSYLLSRRYAHRQRVAPRIGINVLDRDLSLAGFEVTAYGRFWVTAEAQAHMRHTDPYVTLKHYQREIPTEVKAADTLERDLLETKAQARASQRSAGRKSPGDLRSVLESLSGNAPWIPSHFEHND